MNLKHGLACVLSGLVGSAVTLLLAGSVLGDESSLEILEELSVKRLNIVEDNGQRALVLANSRSLPGSFLDGVEQPARRGVPGILFYNPLGDEIGGLIYPARTSEGGYDGGVQLSMDQIKQTGQAIALRHWRNGDYVRSVLEITDYATDRLASEADDDPDLAAVLERLDAAETAEEQDRIWFYEYLPLLGEKGYLAHRVFLGSEGAGQRRALLEIKDSRSRPRIRLMVDEDDRPTVQILDEAGEVVSAL